uniref:Ion_trans domain-containing protein n=1 Tax=Meloidogyne hapla TaxID=6305 RepID=A0A1I8BKG2_MELHA
MDDITSIESVEPLDQRGISGSDCVYENANAKIRCTRWNDPLENREKFWTGFSMNAVQVERPSGMYRALFYFVLLQLLLFVLDIGASMVMCRRYKLQKDGETIEKRISMALTGIIYFTNSLPPFDSCMGTAFKLFVGMFVIFGIGCFLTHFSRILLIREQRKGRQDFQRNGGGRGAAMELM